MRSITVVAFSLMILGLVACGGCPTGINTTDISCPGYVGSYQQPYYGNGTGYVQPGMYGQPGVYGQPGMYGQPGYGQYPGGMAYPYR